MGTVEEKGKERERERLIKEVVGRLGLNRNWDLFNEGKGEFTLWNRDSDIDNTLSIIRNSCVLPDGDVPVRDWDNTTLMGAWMRVLGVPCKAATLPNLVKFRDWLSKPPGPEKGPFSIKEKDKGRERSGDGHGSE